MANNNNYCEFLLLPFVEIEVRLGTVTNGKFDNNIDNKYFENIKKVLETGSWDSIKFIQTKEKINKNFRLIDKNNLIIKENVINKVIQLNKSPFDIKFSINQEFSLNSYISSFESVDIIRKKNRTSYINSTFKYDLTVVEETKNNIVKKKNEIEIELLITPETLTWTSEYIADFLDCKIYDLVNIVEEIPKESFKVLVN